MVREQSHGLICSQIYQVWLARTEFALIPVKFLVAIWCGLTSLTRVQTSDAILSLSEGCMSANQCFMAMKYRYGLEPNRALERGATGEARIIPVIPQPPIELADIHFAYLGRYDNR